jgi:ribosomal protein L16 Arg81 hydroxylase
MSKIPQNKYNCDLVVAREPEVIYTLRRINDGLTKTGSRVQYIEWNEDRSAKESHDDIQIGRSLMLEPRMQYTWLTTKITEIISQSEDCIKFQTENSLYELTKISKRNLKKDLVL